MGTKSWSIIASSLLASLALSPGLLAGGQGSLSGCYVPVGGFAESASYSPSEQIGTYRVVLMRKEAQRRKGRGRDQIQNRLVIEGPFRGVFADESGQVLSHVLGTEDREGLIYTREDTFALQSVVPCNDSEGVILSGTETINPIAGTGRFAGLQVGGSIEVNGTVNTCTGLNDFDVVPGEGELCFGDPGQ
jgi:hypothetical protein